MNAEIKNKIDKLNENERNEVFKYLWSKYIKEDVQYICEEFNIKLDDTHIDRIVYDYVYNGNYDNDISYWDNIKAVIRKEIANKVIKKEN